MTDAPAWNTGVRGGGRKKQSDKVTTPLPLPKAPPRGHKRCAWFAETYLRVPSGKGARHPFVFRPWQRKIVSQILPQRGVRPRQALVELARGQGKSTLACAIAMYLVFADGEEAPTVILVASNERQAERLLLKMWRMIQLNPELENRSELYKSAGRIEVGFNGGQILALPSRFDALQGWEGHVILDEAHVVDTEVYDALVTQLAKTSDALLLTISTPGDSQESLLWRLVQQGRTGEDPSFRYITFSAPEGCDPWDRNAWKAANPALGDFLNMDGIEASAHSLLPHRESQFRRLHLCQWAGSEDHWIPWGIWEHLAAANLSVLPGTPVALGFDGSWTRDSTALIGCTVPTDGQPPHLFVVGAWEYDGPGWRTPIEEVEDAVRRAFETWDVLELVADPAHWRSEIERWRVSWGDRVADYPQAPSRMIPATDRLYQAILEGNVTHDGADILHRHVHNAVAVEKNGGVQLHKPKNAPSKESPVGRIDAAVAAVMAHDRAVWHSSNKTQAPTPFFIAV